ncbi:MAG TPA: hypothetical protein VKZ48_03220, partial [Burkholderiales bacterium]|nr:hypothetical protein [Burkholderiales bacterium]
MSSFDRFSGFNGRRFNGGRVDRRSGLLGLDRPGFRRGAEFACRHAALHFGVRLIHGDRLRFHRGGFGRDGCYRQGRAVVRCGGLLRCIPMFRVTFSALAAVSAAAAPAATPAAPFAFGAFLCMRRSLAAAVDLRRRLLLHGLLLGVGLTYFALFTCFALALASLLALLTRLLTRLAPLVAAFTRLSCFA